MNNLLLELLPSSHCLWARLCGSPYMPKVLTRGLAGIRSSGHCFFSPCTRDCMEKTVCVCVLDIFIYAYAYICSYIKNYIYAFIYGHMHLRRDDTQRNKLAGTSWNSASTNSQSCTWQQTGTRGARDQLLGTALGTGGHKAERRPDMHGGSNEGQQCTGNMSRTQP